MSIPQTFKGTASILTRKRVPLAGGGEGFTTVIDSLLYGDITVTINVQEIIRVLGEKAMGNKSKTAKAFHGVIVAKASNLRKDR